MKKINLIFLSLLAMQICNSQNVGIGTTTPVTQLHLMSAGSNSLRIEHTGGTSASLELKTTDGPFDGLELYKRANGASGTQAGISLSNLSQVISGATAGALMTGTITNSPMYFITNNTQRMRINANGHVAINNTNPEFGWLQVENNDNIGSIYARNFFTGGTAYGVVAQIESTSGMAVLGSTYTGGGTSFIGPGSYGVVGQAGSTGTAVGAFATSGGTAIKAEITTGTGTALLTIGDLKLQGIGEGNGKVLMSDATGNATWQNLPAGSTSWTLAGNDIHNNNTGTVGVGVIPTPFAKFHVKRTDNSAAGPVGQVGAIYGENGSSNDGSGVLGISFAPRFGANAFAGVTGMNLETGADHFGVIGQSDGTSVGGYSAGVGGYGDNGVLGYSQSTTGAGVLAQSGIGKTALELNNGFIKVSGTNKSVFTVTAQSGLNIVNNYVVLNYSDQSTTDIIMATHHWQGSYIGAVGVFWTGSSWAIFRQDQATMPNGEKFNVMVVKQ